MSVHNQDLSTTEDFLGQFVLSQSKMKVLYNPFINTRQMGLHRGVVKHYTSETTSIHGWLV
jgi:hypothetical protein